jgi:hypothetical protein
MKTAFNGKDMKNEYFYHNEFEKQEGISHDYQWNVENGSYWNFLIHKFTNLFIGLTIFIVISGITRQYWLSKKQERKTLLKSIEYQQKQLNSKFYQR